MGDVKPGNSHCPCGDSRCLLWEPRPADSWSAGWCGNCYPQAVARHWDAGKVARMAALRKQIGWAA